MSNQWLFDAIKDNPAIEAFNKGKSVLPITSLNEEALIAATSFQQNKRPIVIVKSNAYTARRLYNRIATLVSHDECMLYEVEDSIRVQAIASSPEMVASKVAAYYRLLNNPNQLVITHGTAILRQLPQPSTFRKACISISINQEITMDECKKLLINSGYEMVSHVDIPLTFAIRGGIIDVFSMNYDNPIRIEFFDVTVESIRFFDSATQKTIEQCQEVTIIPANDILFTDDEITTIKQRLQQALKEESDDRLICNVEQDIQFIEKRIIENRHYPYYAWLDSTSNLLEYIPSCQVILSPKQDVNESIKLSFNENVTTLQEMVQDGLLLPKFAINHQLDDVLHHQKVCETETYVESSFSEVNITKLPLDLRLTALLKEYTDKKIVLSINDIEFKKISPLLDSMKVPYQYLNNTINEGINITFSSLYEGFYCKRENIVVLTAYELLDNKPRADHSIKQFKNAEVLKTYLELKVGDYVVHHAHGVGQYMGIENREVMGYHKDYLKVIYRGNAFLLIPLEQFHLVRKFVSSDGVVPKLNKLGSNEWEKTKKKIKDNVNDLAERLVALYKNRTNHIGYQYGEDTELQKAFEDEFNYECTEDQKKAIQEVKQDLMSDKPMERLLCGDVGFGKTEVAIRAAFKVVEANKQVAFLCPTTILSSQHMKTFTNRFKNYPVRIALINRFTTTTVQHEIIKDIKNGKIDILIGTHRLLSKDISFKDLGLLVIDEEQRFGVEHKERIKEMTQGVDVLSLSATPIPRTLQMSLIGVRQLSQLETPPQNRYPVATYIVEKNINLIKEVIQRELARNGQVFYLTNNIEEITVKARLIQKLIPESRVGIAHGKMGKNDIEDIMISFNEGEIDVLLCTTIIETGLDIPNANTIIVENADRFGLAQLYQIKGRVGRSNRLAYAYLMVESNRQLSEIASKRLQAMKEFTKLGSGYKIAMRDLTIRGAGDMLGPSQSGFIDTVGLDMYLEMLSEAIDEQQGIIKEEKIETIKPQVAIDSYIPENFSADDFDKITLYQKLHELNTLEEIEQFEQSVIDEYGKLPKAVIALFDKKRLEYYINHSDVKKYSDYVNRYEIIFSLEYSNHCKGIELFEGCTKISPTIELKYVKNRIIIVINKSKEALGYLLRVFQLSKEVRR